VKRTRIVHILGTAAEAGTGISSLVHILAAYGSKARYQHVACFLSQPGPWIERLQAAGVEAGSIDWRWRYDPLAAARLWQFLRASHADLVHVHYGGRFIRAVARHASRAPIVLHLHGRAREAKSFRPLKVPARDVSLVIATSKAVAAAADARKVRVVYPATRSHTTRAAGEQQQIVGAAGRLVPIKGFADLLDAFAIILKSVPEARLEIAGDGSERGNLEQRARELGLSGSVAFLGWRHDLSATMGRWRVFVQPAREEAIGITVMEAMAAGLPVVATRVGGLAEIVEPDVTGLLVRPAAPAELAEAAIALLRDDTLRRKLGEAGRQRAGEFKPQRFASEIEAVYDVVLLQD
jgi:glycosyltransferase involved in cell wall biosynthesis